MIQEDTEFPRPFPERLQTLEKIKASIVTFVCKYDVLCLTETITDNTDVKKKSYFVVHMLKF